MPGYRDLIGATGRGELELRVTGGKAGALHYGAQSRSFALRLRVFRYGGSDGPRGDAVRIGVACAPVAIALRWHR